jgi:transcriptional regulator with XRE-family HTH domain
MTTKLKKTNTAKSILEIRHILRMTQRTLGEELDISGAYVHLLETAQRKPSGSLLEKIEHLCLKHGIKIKAAYLKKIKSLQIL